MRLTNLGLEMNFSSLCTALILLLGGFVSISQAAEPTYVYRMEIDRKDDVCRHMLAVLNTNFRNLWDAPPLDKDDANFAPDGPYAFQRLPGVDHNYKMTFEMRYSKSPSTPEFDAIRWKEARAIFGDPPDKSGPVSKVPMPALVANFDFDNDGQLDTVIKSGFVKGYSYIANARTVGLHEEYIMVWRGRSIELTNPISLWSLVGGASEAERPIDTNATYLRPFAYKAHTYVARYDMDVGKGGALIRTPPYIPTEIMSILNFSFTGEVAEFTKAPTWTIDTVCRYRMKQIKQ